MTEQEKIIMRLGAIGRISPMDLPSLDTEKGKILYLMSDQKWHPSTSIQLAAQNMSGDALRTMRKLREWGIFNIEKRKISKRIWEYRLDVL